LGISYSSQNTAVCSYSYLLCAISDIGRSRSLFVRAFRSVSFNHLVKKNRKIVLEEFRAIQQNPTKVGETGEKALECCRKVKESQAEFSPITNEKHAYAMHKIN
jgi:hypothetical protein